jgi:serine protease Do
MGCPRKLLLLVPFLTGALLLTGGCRRGVSELDEVQRVAYAVKPAVVRVSALATADFRYPTSAIERLDARLAAEGYEAGARIPPEAGRPSELSVQTGAGGSGSGFIIHPNGLILTSAHVVAPVRDPDALSRDLVRNGAIAALVQHFPLETLRAIHRDQALARFVEPLASAGRIEKVQVVRSIELSNGETLPYTIRRYSPPLHERGTDLAILEIGRKGLPSLRLGDSEAAHVGESIWAVGYPAVASSSDELIGGWLSRDTDLEATFNPGTITAIRRNVANVPVFQSNVAIYRGNSGGPAVNRRGEVIGVSTWGHANAEQIKFLVPVNVAREILNEAQVPAGEQGEFDRYYRDALDAAADGRWLEARTQLARASRLFPNSPDLVRFASDAERAIDALPPWKIHPVAVSLLGLTAVAAILITGVAMLRSPDRKLQLAGPPLPAVETVVAPRGAAETAGRDLGRLTILSGPRAGEKLKLAASGIRIGRETTICEIVLDNPKVSRLHAEVVSIDDRVLLIDRNSSNGTYVNDQKIEKQYLEDGDIIHFGGRNAIAAAFHV